MPHVVVHIYNNNNSIMFDVFFPTLKRLNSQVKIYNYLNTEDNHNNLSEKMWWGQFMSYIKQVQQSTNKNIYIYIKYMSLNRFTFSNESDDQIFSTLNQGAGKNTGNCKQYGRYACGILPCSWW